MYSPRSSSWGFFAASFNMIFGYMGQLTFGHAAYYGVGAYTTGLLMVKANVPLLVCLPLSMLSAGLCAAVLGYFCVKLRGIYFAILTMAFGQLVYYIIFQWYSFTGGDNGLQGIVPPAFLGKAANPYYFFTLIIVTLGMIALWKISESPFGYTMRAIRDNAERTEFIGINVQRYMHLNFIIAAMFAGLAGALWGPFNRSVAPGPLQLAAFWNAGVHGRHGRAFQLSRAADRFRHLYAAHGLCHQLYGILADGKRHYHYSCRTRPAGRAFRHARG